MQGSLKNWSVGDVAGEQIYRICYAESDTHHHKQPLWDWATGSIVHGKIDGHDYAHAAAS